jgi:hypothetical protein
MLKLSSSDFLLIRTLSMTLVVIGPPAADRAFLVFLGSPQPPVNSSGASCHRYSTAARAVEVAYEMRLREGSLPASSLAERALDLDGVQSMSPELPRGSCGQSGRSVALGPTAIRNKRASPHPPRWTTAPSTSSQAKQLAEEIGEYRGVPWNDFLPARVNPFEQRSLSHRRHWTCHQSRPHRCVGTGQLWQRN